MYSDVANSPLVSQLAFQQGATTRMTTTKQYDRLNRLTQIASAPSGTGVAPVSFNYSYNTANQRTQEKLMEEELGEAHAGALRRESGAAKAERLVGQELKRLGWTAADLAARRKSDPLKPAIAARLRTETTLLLKAIAARVHLGTPKDANTNLHKWMQAKASENPTQSHSQL